MSFVDPHVPSPPHQVEAVATQEEAFVRAAAPQSVCCPAKLSQSKLRLAETVAHTLPRIVQHRMTWLRQGYLVSTLNAVGQLYRPIYII